MTAIGIGLVWAGYTTILYSWCLFRGYNITPKQLLSQQWPPATSVKDAGKATAEALKKVAEATKTGR